MPVVQQGQINTTALITPDIYVQIVAPSVSLLNGVPTNILGIVGTAQWGPKNAPIVVSSMADYSRQFGAIQNRKYDMGTQVALAVQQGANNMRCVRVTDGTDVAASIAVLTNCITFTSKYTGSLANADTVTIANGSQANTYKATVARVGYVPEVFDNISGAGNAFWVNLAAAINSGQSGLRGPSSLIVATAGAGVTAPSLATYTLTGGTDGATTITGTTLVGSDTTPRTGMYALRNSGASVGFLADCDDTTTFTNQVAYGLSEGTYMVGVTPAGDSIATAITNKASAGIDSYAFKYMLGDWIYWNDPVNNVNRLVSPQGLVAGLLANLSPEQSSLNKQVYGVTATQKSQQGLVYSSAELTLLGQAGIDVVCNPVPGGNYFGVRFGHNSSSNPVIHGDNYTRMTNYQAYSINAGMGKFVGKLQGSSKNDPTRRGVSATLSAFEEGMKNQNMIDAYSVVCDLSNNPLDRQALGYLQADVKVRYLSIVEYFIVNMEGGQSVTVTRKSTKPA